MILRRPDGALNFWVYDSTGKMSITSHFPSANRDQGFETVEKLSPESCMGCHYDLVTRKFDVLSPSADVLRLAKTTELPIVCAENGEDLVDDN